MSETLTAPIPLRKQYSQIGTDILYPKKGRQYYWAATDPAHPQSWRNLKRLGYTCTQAIDAESLGLQGYEDKLQMGLEPVTTQNCILYGNLILMETLDENWQQLHNQTQDMVDAIQGDQDETDEERLNDVEGINARRS